LNGDDQRNWLALRRFVESGGLLDPVVLDDEILDLQAVDKPTLTVFFFYQRRNQHYVGLGSESCFWSLRGGRFRRRRLLAGRWLKKAGGAEKGNRSEAERMPGQASRPCGFRPAGNPAHLLIDAPVSDNRLPRSPGFS